ncbi:hypothetical protein [Hymenobacter taeanensis]|uniref:hypothetical protein n=1 Tax=Hymenobacter taeanensis TaxID=2735321 RepID=UPI001C129E72|nr:hypothetical protein [Hymenobacter taeanensis]
MIQLEYFTSSDFDQLITWIDSPHLLMNWAGPMFNFPLNRDKLDWYLQDSNELGQSEVFTFRAVDTDTGTVVGHISLGSISEKKQRSPRKPRVYCPRSPGQGLCSAYAGGSAALWF